ncbi:MAG: ArnT family glycosyltransferase [Gemmatimonadota bacterium]
MRLRQGALFGLLWAISTLYAWHHLDRDWIPHDEGTHAHSAERVLQGELPHRDFDELYTGGLSFWNALAFETLGTNLRAIRLAMFAIFLVWVPAVYYVASRFAGPLLAGLVTLLAVAWSIPNYPGATPSWYNLFFAVFCGAALLRFVETRRQRWLVAAGLAAGLSILAKIVGFYLVGAAVLSLVYLEQTEAARETSGGRVYSLMLTAAAAGLVVALALIVRTLSGPESVVHFVVPGGSLAVFLTWEEWRHPRPGFRTRCRRLLSYLVPFGAGAVLALVPFLAPYVASGSMADLGRGLFVLPQRRLEVETATRALPPLHHLVVILALTVGIWIWMRGSTRLRAVLMTAACAAGAALLVFGHHPLAWVIVWASMRPLVPLVVVWGLLLVARTPLAADPGTKIFLLLALAALCSLIQIPFAGAAYFLYVAPLVALAALAVASLRPAVLPLFAVMVAFFALYAGLWIAPGQALHRRAGESRTEDLLTARLDLERGGLWVRPEDAELYEQVVGVVRQHAGESGYIYATPDSPEIYFLSGLRNPGRTLFDFLDDPRGRNHRILSMLRSRDVDVVVINSGARHSGPVSGDLLQRFTELYPNAWTVGRFTVRWRDEDR